MWEKTPDKKKNDSPVKNHNLDKTEIETANSKEKPSSKIKYRRRPSLIPIPPGNMIDKILKLADRQKITPKFKFKLPVMLATIKEKPRLIKDQWKTSKIKTK